MNQQRVYYKWRGIEAPCWVYFVVVVTDIVIVTIASVLLEGAGQNERKGMNSPCGCGSGGCGCDLAANLANILARSAKVPGAL